MSKASAAFCKKHTYGDAKLDEGRFLQLFLKHERQLAGAARAVLPTWDAVDDVLQESSLVMWRKIDQLQSDDEFMVWARAILRFEVLKYWRRCGRDRLLLDDELLTTIADEAEAQPSAVVEQRRRVVRTCLDKFSPENQRLILSQYTHDDSITELAQASGRTANSLYKRLGRLRVKLHNCVHQHLDART